MKFGYLLISTVSAYWGDWVDGVYCDISNPLIAEIYSENPKYNEGFCADFCRTSLEDMPEDYVGYGRMYCCDYEAWSDDTFNCYLYEGTKTENQDYFEYPNEYFSHFIFSYSELKAIYKVASLGVIAALALMSSLI